MFVASCISVHGTFLTLCTCLQLPFLLLCHLLKKPCSMNSCLTLCACTQLYTMYASRFDEAQLGYCKWLKSCKAFADLIRTVEVSLGLLADQHWINRQWHFTNWKGRNCMVTFLSRFLQLSRLCKGLPISSYMLCPIQRIPRYRLLLEGAVLYHNQQIHINLWPLIFDLMAHWFCRLPEAPAGGSLWYWVHKRCAFLLGLCQYFGFVVRISHHNGGQWKQPHLQAVSTCSMEMAVMSELQCGWTEDEIEVRHTVPRG